MDSEREYRFLLPRPQAGALIEAAVRHTSLVTYDRARPVAYARTTYLDTPDLHYYQASVTGPVRRRIRVREYAAAEDLVATPVFTGGCFLELKESTGCDRTKHRAAVDAAALEGALQRGIDPDLAARLAGTPLLAELERHPPGQLLPRLTTWYRRVTLADEGARVRITMDEGIAYGRPAALGRAGQPVPPPDLHSYGPSRVIEVKVIGPPPAWLTQALAGLPEEGDYSKFRMGMRAMRRRNADVGRRTMPLDIPGLPLLVRTGGNR